MKNEEMVKMNCGIELRKKMFGNPNRILNSISVRLKKPRMDGYMNIGQTSGVL